jgi:3D (Asp-Asp-Asp) domain-containing protein
VILSCAFAQTKPKQMRLNERTQTSPKNQVPNQPFGKPASLEPAQILPATHHNTASSKTVFSRILPSRIASKPTLRSHKTPTHHTRPPSQRSSRVVLSKSLIVRSTAYNSTLGQTDSSPFQTSTGTRTRFGIVALSRDLLRRIPYGSRVLLEDMGSWAQGRGRGKYNAILSKVLFVVEDTMHPRKTATVDVWFPAHHQAVQWGVRRMRIRVVQVGR